MRICVEQGCTEHSPFFHPERNYVDVSFVYRSEQCSDCGENRNAGFYYDDGPPEYTQHFVCRVCA